MTRRRWIADEFSGDSAALIGAHAAHLTRTLRARVGQEFEVACGEVVRRATICHVGDDRVEFVLGEEIAAGAVLPITLLLSVFKFDRMEWAIEKCTELNVTTIVPLIASRTEKHLAKAADKRVERWRRIAREASEQSRRSAPPEVTAPMKVKDALAQAQEGTNSQEGNNSVVIPSEGFSPSRGICGSSEPALKIVLAETKRAGMLAEVLHEHRSLRSLTLAIGPEGGWTPEELQRFQAAQWISASLGDTILRAETAAIAALAIARSGIQPA